MRGTLQYRFTTARVQWPCSTDIHWACLITQSGPARYVIVERSIAQIEVAQSGGPVTGLEALRERERFTETASLFLFFAFFFYEDHKVAVKNYAVHQSLEDPGSASQQSECNDPAPH